jgi:hypothetical protein
MKRSRPLPRATRFVVGLAWLGLATMIVVIAPEGHRVGWAALVLVIGAGIPLGALAFQRSSALMMVGDRLYYKQVVARRQVHKAGEQASIVRATVRKSGREAPRPAWLLLNGDGVTQVSLMLDAWDEGGIEMLEEQLQLPCTQIDEPMTASELATRYVGSLPWWVIRPNLAVVCFAVGTMIVVAAVRSV